MTTLVGIETTNTALPSFTAELASEIRARAARQRVSNKQIGRAIRSKPSGVSRRMNGHTPWSADELAIVARVLDCQVQDLFPAPASNYRYCINSISLTLEPVEAS
jgi:hypothetical protein